MYFYNYNNLNQFVKHAEIKEDEKLLILTRGNFDLEKENKAKVLLKVINGLVFSTENYKELYDKTEEGIIPEPYLNKIEKAHEWNKDNVSSAMNSGASIIIVNNNNIRSWDIKPYIELAREYDYKYIVGNPNSPWWHYLFKKSVSNKAKDKLIDMLYDKVDKNDYTPFLIEIMLKGLEYEPEFETKKLYPWENEEIEEEEEDGTVDGCNTIEKDIDSAEKGISKESNFNIKKSFVEHIEGHKDSSGNLAQWVIKSHDNGKILSSHKTEEEAKKHLQDIYKHRESFLGLNSLNNLISKS